jgi:hypothetical protein
VRLSWPPYGAADARHGARRAAPALPAIVTAVALLGAVLYLFPAAAASATATAGASRLEGPGAVHAQLIAFAAPSTVAAQAASVNEATATTLPPLPSTSAPADDSSGTLPRIIPLPNSGRAPQDAGDRGGWLQVSLFWFILAALAVLGLLVWRDSRRKLRKAATAQAMRAPAGSRATSR